MFKLKDLVFNLFLISITFNGVLNTCPDAERLKPCKCVSDGEIFCSNVTGIQLKETFNKLGESQNEVKRFKVLVLEGPGCDEVLDNTFDKFSFSVITMWHAPNLAKIHTNAFNMSRQALDYFYLSDIPALDVNNLFDIINQFEYIRCLHLVEVAKLEEISSLAFKELKYLDIIRLRGLNIKKINEKAFYNLNSLNSLELGYTSLSNIGENIFVFSQKSEKTLKIDLFGNHLMSCNRFHPKTFSEANRPLKLDFKYNKQMTCLPEKVFRPFFKANSKNTIDLKDIDFDCNNCESVWLRNATQYHQRLLNIKCENGNNLDDSNNFKSC